MICRIRAVKRTNVMSLAFTAVLAGGLLTGAMLARAADTVQGFSYVLHNATPSAGDLDKDPSQLKHSAELYVMQGGSQAIIWSRESDVGDVDKARFARGDLRMGLFLPRWDLSRSASEESRWTSYGDTVKYKTFQVTVKPGDDNREIAGFSAKHYVLKADIVERTEGDSADTHTKISSDLWVLEKKPFSWAPYATPGIYGDPRLQVAVYEKLSRLGMVVRAETTYSRQAQDADGKPLAEPYNGTYLTWITDLQSAQVPVVNPPESDRATLKKLRSAFREDPQGYCKTVLDDGTPDFVARELNVEQQKAFLEALGEQCRKHMKQGG